MRTYTPADLTKALIECGLEEGQTVLIHSSLMHLGRLADAYQKQSSECVYKAIRALLGTSGTIVVPTFTFAFCGGTPFSPEKSPSVGMGAFSEYVRQLPNAIRSPHPMQSVAAVGPAATEICANETASSFDLGGPFAKLLELGGVGLLLGAPMQSFSMVHFAEEQCQVPYRYWKEFTGSYGPEGYMRTFSMYVRDLEIDPTLDLSKIEKELQTNRKIREANVGSGKVKSFKLRDFNEVTIAGLQRDPCWLIK